MDIIGYHGTSDKVAKLILSNGFKIDNCTRKLPGDLGRGIYAFLDREDNSGEAISNAYNFVKNIRKNISKQEILEILCSVEDEQVLDFNDQDNITMFQEFREKNKKLINEELKSLEKNGSFKRGNLDGHVIEMLLRWFNLSISIVIKDTYTWFGTEFDSYKKSNFFNGREMCIRNLDVIKKTRRVER